MKESTYRLPSGAVVPGSVIVRLPSGESMTASLAFGRMATHRDRASRARQQLADDMKRVAMYEAALEAAAARDKRVAEMDAIVGVGQ